MEARSPRGQAGRSFDADGNFFIADKPRFLEYTLTAAHFGDLEQVAADKHSCIFHFSCFPNNLKHFLLPLRIETQRGLIQQH